MDSGKLAHQDLTDMVNAVLNDIVALFHAISDRVEGDSTTESLCSTGGYLCERWRDMLCSQIEELPVRRVVSTKYERDQRRAKAAEMVALLNRPAA